MDGARFGWYFSGMSSRAQIPVFALYGETGRFPDLVHSERISDRASDLGWTIRAHRHAHMAQLFCLGDGQAEVRIDQQSRPLLAPVFLFLPPQVVHGFSFRPGTEGLVQSFPLSVLTGLAHAQDGFLGALSRPLSGRPDALVQALSTQLHDALRQTGPLRAPLILGLTQALLAHVAATGQGEAHDAPSQLLARLDGLIAGNLALGWKPADYARALSVSTGHLNRLVRAGRGVSTSGLIETATMTEACRLLAFTRMTAAEVGYRLGFADPSYFARRFRHRIGEAPGAYRARFSG